MLQAASPDSLAACIAYGQLPRRGSRVRSSSPAPSDTKTPLTWGVLLWRTGSRPPPWSTLESRGRELRVLVSHAQIRNQPSSAGASASSLYSRPPTYLPLVRDLLDGRRERDSDRNHQPNRRLERASF